MAVLHYCDCPVAEAGRKDSFKSFDGSTFAGVSLPMLVIGGMCTAIAVAVDDRTIVAAYVTV